jgi:DNA modification methylase
VTRFTLHHGDCLKVLRTMPSCSVDAIVCDPPAGIAFMGKEWDKDKGGRDAWIAWMQSVAQECLRVIKPGGHALVWALPRTSHWTGMAWENGGWEPRDKIVHLFGTGFPKSLDVNKAIDKAAGAEREVVGYHSGVPGMTSGKGWNDGPFSRGEVGAITIPATEAAKQWEGWGTALKPAAEDWWLFRKPIEGTIAGNVLAHGTGALNIDECRISAEGENFDNLVGRPLMKLNTQRVGETDSERAERAKHSEGQQEALAKLKALGRWPANLITDGSDEVVAGFPADRPSTLAGRADPTTSHSPISDAPNRGLIGFASQQSRLYADSGSAARFFYCTKASRRDREEGCEHLEAKSGAEAVDREEGSAGMNSPRAGASRTAGKVKNHHPTVKNTDLMQYLCRLVTPKGGVVLDPFMGSGSTGKACMYEGFGFIGIEQEAEYLEIAKARIEYALRNAGFSDDVEVKAAPKAGSSLKVLRKKADDKQIDLFAQLIAPESQEVLDD